MMRWLPLWRIAANPFCSRMRQMSKPERSRSLPNRNLDLSHENFIVKPPGDFGRFSRFKKQRERLNEVGARFFDRIALARDIEFRAQRHETIVVTFDNGGQALRRLH